MAKSLADDLQAIAFHDVVVDTQEYRLRLLYRWYSKTFATPLHLVPSIPLTDVLVAFWETRYEEMDEPDLEEERKKIIETEEERVARLIQEDADRVEADAFVAQVEASARAAVNRKITDVKMPEQGAIKVRDKIAEPALPSSAEIKRVADTLPETVSVKFAATDFFNELVDRLDNVDEDRQSSKKP